MSDYIKDLESFEDSIMAVLMKEKNHYLYLSDLIKKVSSVVTEDKTTLRDAIIAMAGKKKLEIERGVPKQLKVIVAEKKQG
jgi:hypothetical protein